MLTNWRSAVVAHDLGHTNAAWQFCAECRPLVVSRRLGHAQLTMISETYGGLVPEADDVAFEVLAQARRNA